MLRNAELNAKFDALSNDLKDIKKTLLEEVHLLKASLEASLRAAVDEMKAIFLGSKVNEKFTDIDAMSTCIDSEQQCVPLAELNVDIVEVVEEMIRV